MKKKSGFSRPVTAIFDEPDFLTKIKRPLQGLRDFIPKRPSHPYSFSLYKYEWMGLLTLKIHTQAFSKDDSCGDGRKRRFDFVESVMDNLCNHKLRIKPSELIWVACEEFGFSGVGHVHVLFSFDYLKSKGRMDKLPEFDFSEENGKFFDDLKESADFIWRNSSENQSALELHWSPAWENSGLVDYFCKMENGREEKHFKFSKFWRIHEGLNAA